MKQISEIKPAGRWNEAATVDFVVLDAEDRHRRRVVLVGEHGETYLLNLAKPMQLRDGDGLMLEDGSIVRVTGKPERLIEISAGSKAELARLAWHIGNRHTDLQIVGEALRIRHDHVLEDMLRGLGATFIPIEAPFDPEPGAYGEQRAHGHDDGR
jgi:urease accessory protein